MAVPRVVPQPCNFNSLQCQTSLTALMGAKGIFLRCKTMLVRERVQTGAMALPRGDCGRFQKYR